MPHEAEDNTLNETRDLWNAAATSFDEEADHGLRDPHVRAAWQALLSSLLPAGEGRAALDIGCGTGSLSLLLAEMNYGVTGIDLSPTMLAHAEQKARAAGRTIAFRTMNAAAPQFPPQSFDVLLCRHVLWALPEIDQVLQRWSLLLKPGGLLLMIEGRWSTGAGLTTQQITTALPSSLTRVSSHPLSDQPELWGGTVTDERYAIRTENSPL